MQLKVRLDLDMTLNTMAFTWASWMKQNIDKNFELSQVRYFGAILDAYGPEADAYWKDPKAYDDIEPLPGAVELVDQLRYLGVDLGIVTSTPPGQSAEVKDAWVKKHLGEIPIIHSSDKYKHTAGAILIDDNPAWVQTHIRLNACPGIVYNHDANYAWAFPLRDSAELAWDHKDVYKLILKLHKEQT